ncbi:MAG TPA: CAP domain-containing protein [Xanthobacteraceae bacterium]|nr:CAP domain-containing protein [Xanthobacteraceae bacterium]
MKKALGVVFGLLVLLGPAAAADLAHTAETAISAYRRQHGLPAVTVDAKLMQLAREQAAAMAHAGILEHDVAKPFSVRIARYDPGVACENIAAGMVEFSSALDIWKRSPGHNANLLRKGVTRFGIASAAAPNSKYRMFWALILAGPESRPTPPLRSASRDAKAPATPAAKRHRPAAAEPPSAARQLWNWVRSIGG